MYRALVVAMAVFIVVAVDASARPTAVWLNRFCRGMAASGPWIKEPLVTRGPTELVSGFYDVGGPVVSFSTPGCKRSAPPPQAGRVEVLNASGAVVATQTSKAGRFVEIRLPAGSYKAVGTFLAATFNGVHPKDTNSIVIPPDHTVRQDFLLSIP